MNLEKILVKGLLIASLTSCGGGGSPENPAPIPPTVNSPPVASLSVNPTSGPAPLEVLIKLTCTDPNGLSDIKEYIVSDGNSATNIVQSTPIDITRTYNEGLFSITGECVDNSNARSALKRTDVTVTAPLNPVITQTVNLENFVDLDYTANISGMSEATLEVKFNTENLIATRTINSGNQYAETFGGMGKGNYAFSLSGGGISDSQSISVPNYAPEVNLSNLNLDMKKKDLVLEVELPNPTDKNPEDNPVFYNSATSPDGKVNPILGPHSGITNSTPLTIENFGGSLGPYQIELRFGSVSGGTGSTNLSGNITNLPDSGQLQDNETDLGRQGFVKAYSLETKVLLNEVETDANGNFSLILPDDISGYFLQARIQENNNWNSFVRTIQVNEGDKENLIIRAVPYDNLAENAITPEQFKAYINEIQRSDWIRKWDFMGETPNPFQGIEIVDIHPGTGDYFTLEEQLFIKDVMLTNMSCYTGGMLTEENTFVQIDNPTSDVNYTYDPEEILLFGGIIPNSGWITFAPLNLLQGGDAGVKLYGDRIQIIGGRIRINVRLAYSPGVISHEEGHLFIAPGRHSLSIPYEKTIMASIGILERPSEIDCKAGYLINEENYAIMDSEFPRYIREYYEYILGLEFGNFN